MGVPFDTPPALPENSKGSLYLLARSWYYELFKLSHSGGWQKYVIVVLTCISLRINDLEDLFHVYLHLLHDFKSFISLNVKGKMLVAQSCLTLQPHEPARPPSMEFSR